MASIPPASLGLDVLAPAQVRAVVPSQPVNGGKDCWSISPNPLAYYIGRRYTHVICCCDCAHTVIGVIEFKNVVGGIISSLGFDNIGESDPCVTVTFVVPDGTDDVCISVVCVRDGIRCSGQRCYAALIEGAGGGSDDIGEIV